MFNCCKAVVYIAHIPMNVLHSSVTANVSIEAPEHFTLKFIIVCFNVGKRSAPFFSDLVN